MTEQGLGRHLGVADETSEPTQLPASKHLHSSQKNVLRRLGMPQLKLNSAQGVSGRAERTKVGFLGNYESKAGIKMKSVYKLVCRPKIERLVNTIGKTRRNPNR